MTVANRLRAFAARFGIEAVRANPMTTWRRRLPALLERQGIDYVLDVGANDGGFASELLSNGFKGNIISFEPLPSAWRRLSNRAERMAPTRWTVFPPIALSDRDGEAVFHEAGNSVSSSLLDMEKRHVDAAPASALKHDHLVRTATLDSVMNAMAPASTGAYLKLDVQGAEGLVLQGAGESLRSRIKGVQIEMSLTTLYSGQASSLQLDMLLTQAGFQLWDILPGFRNPKTLQLLQYDGVYIKG